MQQFVVLSSSCIGSTLRLNLRDGGGAGLLKVSVAIGNTVRDITYAGGGLIFDVPVPAGPASPALVDICYDGTPFDTNTRIPAPTLTVICQGVSALTKKMLISSGMILDLID